MRQALLGLIATTALTGSAFAGMLDPEKDPLTFGFIKRTDMAPLAVVCEPGSFDNEGLVDTLEAQANWKALLHGVIDGQLDGTHMLAGQPMAATIGSGTEAILLADRVVMMTNGPSATIGQITDVKLPRPRTRKALLEHPDYYAYRQEVLDFLEEYEHGNQSRKTTGAVPGTAAQSPVAAE